MENPSDRTGFDPSAWGIREKEPAREEGSKRTVAARVPVGVADSWNTTVASIADRCGISKGNAAAVGLVVAMRHDDEWVTMAQQLNAAGSHPEDDGSGIPAASE